jgi:hypothetical protein
MNSNREHHPLDRLPGKSVNDFRLYLGEIKQLRLSGWKGFKLYLRNPQNFLSAYPVIKGIYSSGGKDGVRPWMDLDYNDEVQFQDSQNRQVKYSLSTSDSGFKLFSLLGDLIPPGGHLMVSYEGEQKIHADTVKSLSLGIPPAVTPLGYLLFKGSFQYIKDWYLAEGGFEGPRKLWGEKAPDENWRLNYLNRTALQIDKFLKKTYSFSYGDIVEPARKRAKEIVRKIQKINKKT